MSDSNHPKTRVREVSKGDSVEKKPDRDERELQRTKRFALTIEIDEVDMIAVLLGQQMGVLLSYGLYEVKWLVTSTTAAQDSTNVVIIGLFSNMQQRFSKWFSLIRNIFEVNVPRVTARDATDLFTRLSTSSETQALRIAPHVQTSMLQYISMMPPPQIQQNTEPMKSQVTGEPEQVAMEQAIEPCVGKKRKESEDPSKTPTEAARDRIFHVDCKDSAEKIQDWVRQFFVDGCNAVPSDPKIPALVDQKSYENERCLLNTLPFPLGHIHDLLPPVIKASISKVKASMSVLGPDHSQSIKFIREWFKNILSHYPMPAMMYFEYSTDKTPSSMGPKASVIELHRRILELERCMSDMSAYLFQVLNSSKLRSTSCIPLKLRETIMVILEMGSGRHGKGADFFTRNASDRKVFEKFGKFSLDELRDCKDLYNLAKWLADNRAACMTRVSLAYTGNCLSIVPACMAIALNAEGFLALNDPVVAGQVVAELKVVSDEYDALCNAEVAPLQVYGEQLTRYYGKVYATCAQLKRDVTGFVDIPLPKNIKLSEVTTTRDGHVLLVDSFRSPVSDGHLFYLKDGSHYLIPFKAGPNGSQTQAQVRVQPLEQRRAAAKRFHDWRQALIDKYLAKFFPGKTSTATLDIMLKGEEKVLEWFNRDSHSARATFNLPATASMPGAHLSFSAPFD